MGKDMERYEHRARSYIAAVIMLTRPVDNRMLPHWDIDR